MCLVRKIRKWYVRPIDVKRWEIDYTRKAISTVILKLYQNTRIIILILKHVSDQLMFYKDFLNSGKRRKTRKLKLVKDFDHVKICKLLGKKIGKKQCFEVVNLEQFCTSRLCHTDGTVMFITL